MQAQWKWRVLYGWLIVALGSLVAACGAAPSEGSTGVNGTPIVGHSLPTPSSSVTPGGPAATETAAPGPVRLTLDKASYAPGDRVVVSIENGLSAPIVVSDHHTSCSYVQLQQQQLGTWQPVGTCPLKTPVRLVPLAPRSVTPQRIGIPTDHNAAGTYRVMLVYGASGGNQGNVAYSPTFTVS